jgi:diaminohydroxyphosphoribosylaminopyrimidine deaminase/5-amino-6-(5-phosphoribosylamino)uracil reductase
MADPNPDVIGGGAARLQAHGIAVRVGTCRKQAERLNEVFVKYVRTRRPFVTAKCAATLDGRIATRTGDSKWVTGEAARACVHRLRHAADAILVGVDTIKKDDPSLTTRIDGGRGKDPHRIILDTRLTVPEAARIFRIQSNADTLIVTGPAVPVEKRRRYQRPGVRVVTAAEKDGRIDLHALMADLGAGGITSVLVEGGGRVLASALRAAVVDKIVFFYAPKILGGDDGVPICRGSGPEWMRESIPVTDVRVERFGDDVMIEGYIKTGDG